jgi:pyridoxamine 5'-phosphate oxidase
MIRVAGKVEFLKDKALEERVFRDRPWVKDLLKSGPVSGEVTVFRVAHGEAYFRTMANNTREGDVPRVTF